MGANQEVSGFLAIPRTDNDTNGLIRKFMLYISNDNVTWTAVAGGAWLPYGGEIYFPKVTARYFKLVALEGTHASISELYMLRNTQEYTQRTLTPYYQIDGGAWTSSSEINIKPGSTVKFGPGGGGAGSWAMEGPNNMRVSTKEVTLTNVNEDHSGVYTSYYLNMYNQISILNYTLTVTGIVDVTSVSLNEREKTLLKDETFQLTATVTPDDATNKNVIWTSSEESVAMVSESGLVTAKGVGTGTITVITEDGNFQATCVIVVTTHPTSMEQIEREDLKIYTVGNILFIHSPQQEIIRIYSMDGQLFVEKKKQAGKDQITLPISKSIIFIVRGSTGWMKKIIIL